MRLFYGWYMVGAGSALQFLQAGLMTQSFGVYVAVLQAERGWSKTALSAAAALQQMESAMLGPFLGWFIVLPFVLLSGFGVALIVLRTSPRRTVSAAESSAPAL